MTVLAMNELGVRELTAAELDLIAGGAWSWKEFARSTAGGAVGGAVAGGVAGAGAGGVGAGPGALGGAGVGALGGAATYLLTGWW